MVCDHCVRIAHRQAGTAIRGVPVPRGYHRGTCQYRIMLDATHARGAGLHSRYRRGTSATVFSYLATQVVLLSTVTTLSRDMESRMYE